MNNDELQHFGIPGMKWGKRKAVTSGGLSGSIRRKQMSNATNSLSKIGARKKQVNSELKELNNYAKNPSKIGKSKISTAIRNHQIKSLNKTKSKLDAKEKGNKEALKELKDIDSYQKKRAANKAIIKQAKAAYKANKKDYKLAKKQYDKDYNSYIKRGLYTSREAAELGVNIVNNSLKKSNLKYDTYKKSKAAYKNAKKKYR